MSPKPGNPQNDFNNFSKYTTALLGISMTITGIRQLMNGNNHESGLLYWPWAFLLLGLLSMSVSAYRFIRKW